MADRIGELLVRAGVITAADVERGLHDARASGIRLVSALVRLGKLDADAASRALAEQHGVPAALARHLEGRDVALATQLPAALARELCALPLAVSRAQDSLVVCVRDPRPETADALTRATGRPVVLAVSVEYVLAPLVAEQYGVAPEDDFDVDLESGVSAVPENLPITESGKFDVGSLQLVELDHHGVSKDHSQVGMQTPALPRTEGPRRVTGPFAALTPEPSLELPDRPSGRITRLPSEPAIVHAPPPKIVTEAAPAPAPRRLNLDAALVAITRAETRDFIVESLIAFLRFRYDAGVLFVVKDGLALGQAGFGGDLDDDAITALVVPFTQRSVLRAAHDEKGTYLGEPVETGVVQERFFKLLGHTPRIVVVVPVILRARVINLIYAHGPRMTSDAAAAAELKTLVAAVEEAFVRIIREAKEG